MHEDHPELPVIVMTAHSDLGSAVSAYESGAFEYLPKPFDIDQAVDLVRRAAQAGERAGRFGAAAAADVRAAGSTRRPCSRCSAPSAACRARA